MTFTMPPETAPQDRIWMAFPREGVSLGAATAEREAGYAAWTAVAHAVAEFEPVSMIVDPTEVDRAKRMLGAGIEIIPRVIDDFWMRDSGPTFVHDAKGDLAAVDWIFNGWGGGDWTSATHDRGMAAFIAGVIGVPVVPSLLVNEGGGIHVDGQGTILLTETVQLDPNRNPHADRARVEAEMTRTLGTEKAIWLPQGLTRDYEPFGTRGHVDIVATFPAPGVILLHDQPSPGHPDHAVMKGIRAQLEQATDAKGRRFQIIDVTAPEVQRERMEQGLVPSLEGYYRDFGLAPERLARAAPDAIVMHPGPMNRGIEIDGSVADGPQSVILQQVANGVPIRMAAIDLLLGADSRPAL